MFHGFGDLRSFFSFTFKHKIINLLSLFILFLTVFACFGLYFVLKFHYSKKTKMIIDSKGKSLSALLSTNFDKGIVIFILGLTHQILISSPNIQMFTLITIETIWLVKGILTRKYFTESLLLTIWIL